ncbi:MAG: hypothetical protein FK733_11450 [Asgard group archaeon]|nr:hypothetical protein [Asgard group archaeon]
MSGTKSKRGKAAAAQRNMWVIYPEYFDKNLSRRMGRRVPKKIAYDAPELKRVAMAAQKAGYEVFLDSKKHFSKTWYDKRGRFMVTKAGTKEEQLREIARNIPKVNLPKPAAAKKKKKKSTDKKKKGVYREKTR